MIGILVGIALALVLTVSSIIDFVYASKQHDKTDKNALIASAAMSLISAVVAIFALIILDLRCGAEKVKAGAEGLGKVLLENPELLAA